MNISVASGLWDQSLATAHLSNYDPAARVMAGSTWEPSGDAGAAIAVLVIVGVGLLAAYATYNVQDGRPSGAVLFACSCVVSASCPPSRH
jgi:hypothetical protein